MRNDIQMLLNCMLKVPQNEKKHDFICKCLKEKKIENVFVMWLIIRQQDTFHNKTSLKIRTQNILNSFHLKLFYRRLIWLNILFY